MLRADGMGIGDQRRPRRTGRGRGDHRHGRRRVVRRARSWPPAPVVARIDPQPLKLQFASSLGAHLCYSSFDEAEAALIEETRGVMADKVIITVGDMTADVTAQGFALAAQGRDARPHGDVT